MNEIEVVKPESYKNIPPDQHNAILRRMVKKLGSPQKVERFVCGLSGVRSDVWSCGCRRDYHASIDKESETMRLCEKHRGVVR